MVEVRRQGRSHLGEGDGAARIAQALPALLGVGECKHKVGGDALLATYVADQRKNKKKSTRAAIICFAMLITAMLVTVSAI